MTTQFFTDAFLNATDGLGFSDTVLDGATLKVVLFRKAPVEEYDERSFAGYDTVAELTALPGWEEVIAPGYPFSNTQVAGTRGTANGVDYIPFTSFLVDELTEKVEVEAFGLQYIGTLGGKTDPLILVTTAPFPRGRRTVDADDVFTAPTDDNLGGVRWWVSWTAGLSDGAARVASATMAQISLAIGPPDFQQANTFDVWMYPQRVNFLANPSFEAIGTDFWASDGTLTRVANAELGGNCGQVTGGEFLESNVFPTAGQTEWTIQLLIKASGPVQVGLVSWDDSYAVTACDWGPVNDVWETGGQWTPIRVVRRANESRDAMVRIRAEGGDFSVDDLLCEPGVLLGWPYFDGDEKFGARNDYGWYGTPGASYSTWYNNRNSITSRLFTSPGLPDPTYEFTEEQVRKQGLAYNWVPAGTDVVAHLDVLYPGDLRSDPPPKTGIEPTSPTRYRDLAANAPPTPILGDQWYQTDTEALFQWDGSTWVELPV